jgi:YesN/AraC family two-component response regulator
MYSAACAVQGNFTDQYQRTVSVAVSKRVKDLNTLPDVFKKLKLNIQSRIFNQREFIVAPWYTANEEKNHAGRNEEYFTSIRENLDLQYLDELNMAISAAFSSYLQGRYGSEGVYALCAGLIQIIDEFRNQNYMPSIDEMVGAGDIPSPECYTIDEVYHWMQDSFRQTVLAANHNVEKEYSLKVKRIVKYINNNYRQNFTISELAERFDISNDYLRHVFKEEIGLSIQSYMTEVKIEQSKKLLTMGRYKVYEIAEMTGYSSSHYFSYVFKKATGMSPSEYADSLAR